MATKQPYGWQKGKSGNPKGRPPAEKSWAARMRHYAQSSVGLVMADLEREDYKERAMDAIVRRLFQDAINGDKKAAEIIIERVEGKPRQQVDVGLQVRDQVVVLNPGGGQVEQLPVHKEVDSG